MEKNVTMTVYHLEQAAKGGHVMAMFNLGIAHLYGYSATKDSSWPVLGSNAADFPRACTLNQ